MRALVLLLVLLLLPSGVAFATEDSAPLTLREVLNAAARSHPLLLEATAKREAARGKVVQAAGNFDLSLKAELQHAPFGRYEQSAGMVGFEQPTPLGGLRLAGGYRNGWDFPVYDGKRVTSDLGEAFFEVVLPLLRGGSIDEARFERIEARLLERQAQLGARARRIEILAGASLGWYQWVAQGRRLAIATTLAELAESRAEFLREQVSRGSVARIELVDNARLVATRQAQVIAEEQKLQSYALSLSLFLRDERGRPLAPAASRLPATLPPPETLAPVALTRGEERSRERPDVAILETTVELLREESRLARNQRLPALDLTVRASQDFGTPRSYAPFADSVNNTTVVAGLSFALPVQQRKAKGRIQTLAASTDAVTQQLRFARDAAIAETRTAFVTLTAATEQLALATEARRAAEQMARAERERFVAGMSSVLTVNLREQAAASAALQEVDSLLAHHEAVVRFHASTASPRFAG